jgi:hypothetical protein
MVAEPAVELSFYGILHIVLVMRLLKQTRSERAATRGVDRSPWLVFTSTDTFSPFR